ncbi:MAG: DM13 domain-containing protein [Cyanobacteria bacterium J06639_1]
MKRNVVLSLGLMAAIAFGTANEAAFALGQRRTLAQSTPATQVNSTVVKSGEWVSADHPTKGAVRVVTENGKTYLELDEAFSSDPGPDLFVLLHKEGVPRNYRDSDFVNLGRLQRVSGSQRYEVPAGTDLSDLNSAVVWCRRFNVTFGYAPLNS